MGFREEKKLFCSKKLS
jgi:hypothetical protein